MCGIVGFIGRKDAREIIIKGLEKLEYRGYDSAGMALLDPNKSLNIYKEVGRIENLRQELDYTYPTGFGIGHTRWATHGKPNEVNAHPHYSPLKRFIAVHNGVIENVRQLTADFLDGNSFISETDTEVIIHLIEKFADEMTVEEAIRKTLTLLEGSYALLIIDSLSPDRLYVAKNKSPLLIGSSPEGITIASDVMALVGYVTEYMVLEDKTFAVANAFDFSLYDMIGKVQPHRLKPLDVTADVIEKGDYEHFMLKEIDEQPAVIRRIVSKYFKQDAILVNQDVINHIQASDRIYIIAAGTSMHAGYLGKYFFETIANIPCEVHIASEFAYYQPMLTEKPMFIFISQSGETADLRAVLTNVRRQDLPSLTITNVITSTLAREATYALEIFAGPEIAVASTKAYVAQATLLAILAYRLGKTQVNLRHELTRVALAIEEVLASREVIKDLVDEHMKKRNCFYIGRGIDYYLSLEAALKLKEISYLQTEGFAAGELKHGTIALIEEGTPVIAIITQETTNLNVRSNLMEVHSRGASTMTIVSEHLSIASDDIVIPNVMETLAPLVAIVPTQLIAYYSALKLGNDVDKPRNLAKSVTVE